MSNNKDVVEEYEKELKRLILFATSYKEVYIYGAGLYGRKVNNILKRNNIKISGFVVSNRQGMEEYEKLKVVCIDDIKINNDIGIIMAFKNASYDDICNKNINKNNVFISDNIPELSILSVLSMMNSKLSLPNQIISRQKTSDVHSILITRLDAIGDFICTTPLIREVRKNYTDAHIVLAINSSNKELAINCPYVDEIWLYDRSKYATESIFGDNFLYEEEYKTVNDFWKKYSCKKFDMVIQATEVLRGRNGVAEFILAEICYKKYKVGRLYNWDINSELIYHKLKDNYSLLWLQSNPMHESLMHLDMLNGMGLVVDKWDQEIWTSNDACENIKVELEKLINKDQFVIATSLSGSTFEKNWKKENFVELFDKVYNQYSEKILFILLGAEESFTTSEYIDNRCSNVVNLVGKLTLSETNYVISKSMLYLGPNSGLLHMAAVNKIPAVCLYQYGKNVPYIHGGAPCRWEGLGIKNYTILADDELVCSSVNYISVDRVFSVFQQAYLETLEC